MLLEQVFPGLQNAPGGAIIAAADNIFDFPVLLELPWQNLVWRGRAF